MKFSKFQLGFLAASILAAGFAGCSGGGGDDDEFVGTLRLTGTAFWPRNTISVGREADTTPAANQPFIVLDMNLGADAAPVASGTTDADGNYDVEIPGTASAALIVNSTPRVSGLFTALRASFNKDFDSATDIGCEAGVTSVFTKAITASELNDTRIANFEAAAEIILNKRFVNFFDPADVTLAAAQARALTNDGADEPNEEDYVNVEE